MRDGRGLTPVTRRTAMSYIDGFVIPVSEGKKDAYRQMAEWAAPIFKEHGALQIVECWGDDVPAGKLTDFHRAVKAEPGEAIVFAWIVWPWRATKVIARSWPTRACRPRPTCRSTASG